MTYFLLGDTRWILFFSSTAGPESFLPPFFTAGADIFFPFMSATDTELFLLSFFAIVITVVGAGFGSILWQPFTLTDLTVAVGWKKIVPGKLHGDFVKVNLGFFTADSSVRIVDTVD